MKVSRQELDNFGLLQSLPEPLKNMESGDNFVFYYNVDEENAKLTVFKYEIVKQVNVTLYRDLQSKAKEAKVTSLSIGFFTDTFETRDGLFYEFLRTYNEPEKVKAFYSYLVVQDKVVDINVSTDSINEIYTSDDFRRAISYFSPSRLQSIMFVYDMVNHATSRRLSKSLYGEMIKKIVNLVVYDGGVLPEIGGSLRFMVIGENAKLTQEQLDKLKEAKILVRNMVSIDNVYQITGWALSQNDGKWRTNIADDKAAIKNSILFDYNGRKLYVPNGQTIEQVLPILENPQRSVGSGYRGRLAEVFSHPTLFDYYPKLALMPIVYYYGEASGSEQFYFSPDERGGFININGSKRSGDSLSILLHEIQHFVQHQEGFATGGNLFLAQFVASVGSSAVRKIFACINRMERYFREYLYTDDARLGLIYAFEETNAKTNSSKQIKKQILDILKDKDEYKFKYKTINFYLVLFVAEQGDFTTSEIVTYLESKITNPEVIYELFENISNGYSESKKYRKILVSEGYKDDEYDEHGNLIKIGDVGRILFQGYENLYGEMESRSVQASRFVESEFKNYFYLTKWENTPIQQLTVIDGVEEVIDCDKIEAAVEKKDDDYVLHFKKEKSCEPFLHELGHIVHDILDKLGYKDRIKAQFDKDLYSDNLDEYFVNKFLGYLKSRVDESGIINDLRYKLELSDDPEINKILDEFFTDTQVSERLKFLQSILSK
jgi:hypothetical protein